MVPAWIVLLVSAGYLALLFAVAFYAERRVRLGRARGLAGSGTVYALSLAVYATSWTYYGSVGKAASGGVGFLPIYLGPTLMFVLGWVVLRRIIRVSRRLGITSLADFVSTRYGHSGSLGMLVTAVATIGVVPYIALQLKAVSDTFEVLRGGLATEHGGQVAGLPVWHDPGLYIAVALAAFAILFGTRRLDATERHEGMVVAIAFEAVVKLLIFLAAGFFVTFAIFGGPARLFARAASHRATAALLTMGHGDYGTWVWLTVLSMLAIILLPRQWQVTVVENVRESHLRRAMWLFPLYLLIINIFVLPIAIGGVLWFGHGGAIDPDTYVLALPLAAGQHVLALTVFVGGLSAATGMIIVETIALSTMLSNSLVLPLLLRLRPVPARKDGLTGLILAIRRTAIAVIVLAGYCYYRLAGQGPELVEIGLVSFVAVAQFAPAIFGGLFWRGGTRKGAMAGLAAGFVLWAYTLMVPTFVQAGLLPAALTRSGPWGVTALRPTALFGLTGMDLVSQAAFWSLLINAGLYVAISLFTQPNPDELMQAVQFVDVLADPAATRRLGHATVAELRELAQRFLGAAGAARALGDRWRNDPDGSGEIADPELADQVEAVLAGSVGATCARLIVDSVAGKDQIEAEKLMAIVDEASQLATLQERHRLARELHDSVSQALFSMTLHTRALELAAQGAGQDLDGPVGRNIADIKSLTHGALAEMRALIFQLRPEALREEGLVAAVRKHAAAVAAREGLDVRVTAPDDHLPLPERVEEDLFRIIQEALHNGVKHASPSYVDIVLIAGRGTLSLEVTNDGPGFDPDAAFPGHLGLVGMRERARRAGGQFIVRSGPDGPTTIRAVLPGVLRRPGRSGRRQRPTRPGSPASGDHAPEER